MVFGVKWEATLVEKATSSNLYVAIGFAAATAAVATGIVAAPAVNSCLENPDNPLVGCVIDTVLRRKAPTIAATENSTDPTTEKASGAAPNAETTPSVPTANAKDVNAGETIATTETDAEKKQSEPEIALNVPDFTIARAAPDGLVVIVGTASAGDTVVVKSNGQILGKAKPERNGEWVFVPENPLPTGGVEITVEAHNVAGDITQSPKSEIVLIHEGRDREPIVVASVPGKASDIIQGLAKPEDIKVAEVESKSEETESAPEQATASDSNSSENALEAVREDAVEVAQTVAKTAGQETETASAQNAVEAVTATPQTATSEVAEAKETTAATQTEGAEVDAANEVRTATIENVETAGTAVETNVENTEVTAAVEAGSETSTKTAIAADTPKGAEAEGTNATTVEATQIASEKTNKIAETVPQTEAQDTTQAAAQSAIAAIENFVQPSIDAIEIDGNLNFIAGGGPSGAIMRIYIDNNYVGDALVEEGRWLLETADMLKPGSQRVRADLITEDSTTVAARAEVNFFVEALPQVEVADAQTEVATETAEALTKSAPSALEAVDEASSTDLTGGETIVAETSTSSANHAAAKEMADADTSGTPVDQAVAPTTTTREATTKVVKTGKEPAGETIAAAAETKATPEDDDIEVAMTQTSEEAQVDTLTAVAVGEGEEGRFVSGKAIIRRGDNLWTIARRVYGSGVKYTTIYEANTGQISNPNLIFPGQVFELPLGDD